MITESLTTTGQHVLCRYCGRPIRFYSVIVATSDATGKEIHFLAPQYHPACHFKATRQVVGEAQNANRGRKEIPYWAKMNRKDHLKQHRR